jgi:hypothetical protein
VATASTRERSRGWARSHRSFEIIEIPLHIIIFAKLGVGVLGQLLMQPVAGIARPASDVILVGDVAKHPGDGCPADQI